jgi:ABC-type lipoprotein export system ATPase subunit
MQRIRTLTVVGGKDKSGAPENIRLELAAGSITAIVGPTGSGKSRLLADIEWMAQNDTPTGRTVLFNGECPDVSARFSLREKPVAQLSQNMNFVMDATVSEFIRLHAECRSGKITNYELRITEIIEQANLLAGEAFLAGTPLTALSGGQSRALMIADTALLSRSPIVLIDEIENAGIDRHQALTLLVKNEMIVLMATHDPLLALIAQHRLIIKNGGISAVIQTSDTEKKVLEELEKTNSRMQYLRQQLRTGQVINNTDVRFPSFL